MPQRKGEAAAVLEFRRRLQQPTKPEDSIQLFLLRRWSEIAANTEGQPDQTWHNVAIEQINRLVAQIATDNYQPVFTWAEENNDEYPWETRAETYGTDPREWDYQWWIFDTISTRPYPR